MVAVVVVVVAATVVVVEVRVVDSSLAATRGVAAWWSGEGVERRQAFLTRAEAVMTAVAVAVAVLEVVDVAADGASVVVEWATAVVGAAMAAEATATVVVAAVVRAAVAEAAVAAAAVAAAAVAEAKRTKVAVALSALAVAAMVAARETVMLVGGTEVAVVVAVSLAGKTMERRAAVALPATAKLAASQAAMDTMAALVGQPGAMAVWGARCCKSRLGRSCIARLPDRSDRA